MNPLLFGRECSQREDRRLIWRGRGWRVDVFPIAGKTWSWHLCISHERKVILDRFSPFEHPSAAAALRSVSGVVRGVARATVAIVGRAA